MADLRVPHCEVLTAQSLVRDARAALDAAAVAVVPGTTRARDIVCLTWPLLVVHGGRLVGYVTPEMLPERGDEKDVATVDRFMHKLAKDTVRALWPRGKSNLLIVRSRSRLSARARRSPSRTFSLTTISRRLSAKTAARPFRACSRGRISRPRQSACDAQDCILYKYRPWYTVFCSSDHDI